MEKVRKVTFFTRDEMEKLLKKKEVSIEEVLAQINKSSSNNCQDQAICTRAKEFQYEVAELQTMVYELLLKSGIAARIKN